MTIFKRKISEILQPLSDEDKQKVVNMKMLYDKVLKVSEHYDYSQSKKDELVSLYNQIGKELYAIVQAEPNLHVYSFDQPSEYHGRVSRIISKLRNVETNNIEFTYYMQKAFEDLFAYCFKENIAQQKNYFEIKTPVDIPIQNYAIHKLPDVDMQLHNTVMCTMLRGALLPSMIMAKEIQEYSSVGYVPDFALFRIARDDDKNADNMEYVIRQEASYFDPESLHGKDLLFPDPMNATGGSILTVLEYLKENNITPKSITLFHAISSLQGAFQLLRSNHNIHIYTLWVDPALNYKAYIMPGLGDAGDRLHGIDQDGKLRNVLQLIAHYGQNILQLYRAQVHKIEEVILGKME